MSVKVTVDADKFLDRLDKNIDERLIKSGDQILKLAKKRCPVKTGALRDDIDMELDDKTITIFNTLYYAPFVLLGTKHQKANDYLDTALFQAVIQKNWRGKLNG